MTKPAKTQNQKVNRTGNLVNKPPIEVYIGSHFKVLTSTTTLLSVDSFRGLHEDQRVR